MVKLNKFEKLENKVFNLIKNARDNSEIKDIHIEDFFKTFQKLDEDDLFHQKGLGNAWESWKKLNRYSQHINENTSKLEEKVWRAVKNGIKDKALRYSDIQDFFHVFILFAQDYVWQNARSFKTAMKIVEL